MKSCIYAGSFDCFHNGHANIVKRALKAFDKVYVLVANNPKKKYLFNVSQRINIIKNTVKDSRVVVDVLPDTSLVSDYAIEKGISCILKGIRNIQDTEYEKMLHEVTVSQEHGIDTFVLFSDPKDQKISSSAVKELTKFNANVTDYVPLYTKQLLEMVQNGQHIIGVTGVIGSGKSFISNLLTSEDFELNGYRTTHVDLDAIANNLTYGNGYSKNEEVMELRSKVVDMVNIPYNESGYSPDELKKRLKERVFSDATFNSKLTALYKPVMIREIRKQIANKSGLIILNGALLVDTNMHYLCNNNVIVVNADMNDIKKRLMSRGHDETEINRRLNAQLSFEDKVNVLKNDILENGGSMSIVDNKTGNPVYDLPDLQSKSIGLYQSLSNAPFWNDVTNAMK
jgi:pantetheine-phosphate adenylyltransferase